MNDRRVAWTVRGLLALPFVVALVALARTHWVPVLDLAMTELRVRDVFGPHTPLIGLPGRIGNFPDQGSHPGPLSFYLLWPVYRVFGGSAYGLLAGAAVINVAAAWTAVWIAGRRGGRTLVLGIGAVLMVLLAWFGASVLTQPWNPYLPLVSFVAVLLATWSVLDGDHLMLVPLVGFSTLCAQTHVPYLALCVVLCAVAFGTVAWRWWRAREVDRASLRSALWAVGLGALLWLPVFVDEVRRDPGNITMLRRHFLSPPEDPVGMGTGVKTVLAHFDVTRVLTGTVTRSDDHLATLDDLAGGRWGIGLVVLVAWLVAFVAAVRWREQRLVRLHVVVAVGTAVAVMSTGRIFGKVWYYLTLWAWAISLLAVVATVWTGVLWWRRREGRPLPLVRVAVAMGAVAGLFFVKDAVMVDPPEPRLSRSLDAVLDDTAAALDPDGVYAVVWNDAYYFGSQGYGLISELERRGFDARAYETYRVPVTPHRITSPDRATAELVLATGVNVAAWREREGAEEVAYFEPRSAEELAEYEGLHQEVVDELRAAGLDDLVEMVDTNLFGASLDPRLPTAIEQKMARMLVLGQETAVFLAPPGTF
ncbi:MAG: hypothetical protein RL238_2101 [Actinomycetota bacterium]